MTVHFCAGELAAKRPFVLTEEPRYIQEIYPVDEKLKDIPEGATIAVIGAGLTGVDVATYLIEEKNPEKVVLFSRSSVIPTVRVDPVSLDVQVFTLEKINELIEQGNGTITFDQVEDLLIEELKLQGIDYHRFVKKHMSGGIDGLRINIEQPEDLAIVQAVLPPINLALNRMWDSFAEPCREKFREKYHPFMTRNRSPLPQVSAEILIRAQDEGKLEMPRNITDAKWEDGCFVFTTGTGESFRTEWACNATGLDTHMLHIKERNPLLAQMLAKRYFQVDKYGGVTLDPEDMSAISPRYGVSEPCTRTVSWHQESSTATTPR